MWRGKAQWWFAGGEIVGGLATGGLLVVVGSLLRPLLPEPTRWAVIALVALLVAGHELGWYHLRLPQNPRQVPPSVIFEGGRAGALQFGFEMGTGLRTFMTSGLPHVVATALVLAGPWWAGLAAGASFGVGRALMPLTRLRWEPPSGWDDAFAASRSRIQALLLTSAIITLGGTYWFSRP